MIFYRYKLYLSRYSESTQDEYYGKVQLYLKFLKEYKGRNDIITICNVTKADIYNYIAYMDNLAPGTKKVRLNAIHNFYNFLNRDLSDLLFEDIKLFNIKSKIPKILSRKEIRLLSNYYSDERNNLIIFLFLNTGIRISELTSIKIQNINLKEKFITIKVKGGNIRNVYINETTKNKLEHYIGDREEGSLFNLQRRQIHNIVTKPMRELGIRGSTHTLRHTFASEMYEKTKDILVIKELLGHSTVISTDIYTHVKSEMLKEAVDRNPLANFGIGE